MVLLLQFCYENYDLFIHYYQVFSSEDKYTAIISVTRYIVYKLQYSNCKNKLLYSVPVFKIHKYRLTWGRNGYEGVMQGFCFDEIYNIPLNIMTDYSKAV